MLRYLNDLITEPIEGNLMSLGSQKNTKRDRLNISLSGYTEFKLDSGAWLKHGTLRASVIGSA